mmetsp:Transcript_13963/g.59782  ORF Transcript_13963/g.59782 Transcript_13963/m.59782 type:complete len:345 (-) Transcript_13963:1099-2133(-)
MLDELLRLRAVVRQLHAVRLSLRDQTVQLGVLQLVVLGLQLNVRRLQRAVGTRPRAIRATGGELLALRPDHVLRRRRRRNRLLLCLRRRRRRRARLGDRARVADHPDQVQRVPPRASLLVRRQERRHHGSRRAVRVRGVARVARRRRRFRLLRRQIFLVGTSPLLAPVSFLPRGRIAVCLALLRDKVAVDGRRLVGEAPSRARRQRRRRRRRVGLDARRRHAAEGVQRLAVLAEPGVRGDDARERHLVWLDALLAHRVEHTERVGVAPGAAARREKGVVRDHVALHRGAFCGLAGSRSRSRTLHAVENLQSLVHALALFARRNHRAVRDGVRLDARVLALLEHL